MGIAEYYSVDAAKLKSHPSGGFLIWSGWDANPPLGSSKRLMLLSQLKGVPGCITSSWTAYPLVTGPYPLEQERR